MKLIPIPIRKILKNFKILSVGYGQFKTIKQWNCIDTEGNAIPWYTYPAIEYLNNIDFSEKSVFEFGSGNSSAYWSRRAKSVISIEHDEQWFKKVSLNLKDNQRLVLSENSAIYENRIKETTQKYDVIIIDGMRRSECARVIGESMNFESEQGCLVILDNSDWYQETAKYLREELDLIEIDFHGFGPINGYTWTTSIFVSRNFRFKPTANVQPHFSKAAIEQSGESNV